MTHSTIDGKFTCVADAIADVRESQLPRLKPVNGWSPVIVATQISPRRTSYGVQFWTPEMVAAGQNKNSDGTVAVLVG